MIKGYFKEGFLFFYINGKLNKELESQMVLLKQVVQQYGKLIILGPMMSLRLHEDYKGREKQVLSLAIEEFQFLWNEYQEIQKKIDSTTENISGS